MASDSWQWNLFLFVANSVAVLFVLKTIYFVAKNFFVFVLAEPLGLAQQFSKLGEWAGEVSVVCKVTVSSYISCIYSGDRCYRWNRKRIRIRRKKLSVTLNQSEAQWRRFYVWFIACKKRLQRRLNQPDGKEASDSRC